MQKRYSNFKKTGGRKVVFGPKEKKRLFQLGLCICLFLVIFASRGNELFQQAQAGEKILQIVQENTDFTAAFSSFGESISHGESVWKGVGTLLVSLFGAEKECEPTQSRFDALAGPAYQDTIRMIAAPVSPESMVRLLGVQPDEIRVPEESDVTRAEETESFSEIQEAPVEETRPEVEVPKPPVYDGPALPDNATMEYVTLGLDTIITPVLGEISSGFGYRDHPITEEHLFHAGVDIAADIGTPIAAFADGKVEFIGESSKYGLYVQLDHGNGVKSFYCHCSELLYGKGKSVKVGQPIALVGDTGETTGSHLHLELKKDEILLNPVYYIESVN